MIVDKDGAGMGGTGDGLSHALVNYLGGEVLSPAVGTEPVATLYPCHHLLGGKSMM